jgi:hypothetical protein
MGLFSRVKSTAGSLAGKVGELCGGGLDGARGILEDVAIASGDLEAIGYHVRDIEVTVSVPPSVTVFLVRRGQPSEEAFAAALARRAGQRSAWALIKLVQQADRWSTSLRFGGRECRELAIDLGLRPAIRFLFGRQGQTATAEAEARAREGEPGAFAPGGGADLCGG